MRSEKSKFSHLKLFLIVGGFFLLLSGVAFLSYSPRIVAITENDLAEITETLNATNTPPLTSSTTLNASSSAFIATSTIPRFVIPVTPVDTFAYDQKMLQLANLPPPKITSSTASSTMTKKPGPWPVRNAPYPGPGAILPFNRIVAYYGNLYSKGMGVLGEYPAPDMLRMLASTTAQWTAADPTTPAIPALDYIAVTAQASGGADGKYRARMPGTEIEKVINLAAQINAIVILEIQPGFSNVQTEVPLLAQYLKLPQVHLALDPEFSMKGKERPGTVIGTMDAEDINFTAHYLAQIVRENNLPPKVLIVHRFTEEMITNYKKITPLPEVQIVIDMDGFGFPAKKIGTYSHVIIPEPVQFTGFKLFYKNDVAAGHMMTPSEVLKLSPQPSFVQYQ